MSLFDGRPCRACGSPLIFVPTPNGKSVPCDAAVVWAYPHPSPDSSVALSVVTDAGEVVRGVRCEPRTIGAVAGRVPHWATCPDAERFRAKPAPPRVEPEPAPKTLDLLKISAELRDQIEVLLDARGCQWVEDERGLRVTVGKPSLSSEDLEALRRACAAVRALEGLAADQWKPTVKTGGGEP